MKRKPDVWDVLIILIVVAAIILPRFMDIERPVTVDEMTWLVLSSDFYYALGQREFDKAYGLVHPGVTTMEAGTAAFLLEFPEYRGFGQGYFGRAPRHLIRFLEEKNVDALDLLTRARQIMALGVTIALLLSFGYIWRFFGRFVAFISIMFVALDPFHIGQSKLLLQEGLMGALVLLILLSLIGYFFYGRRKIDLLVSGVAAGLVVLTKFTSLVIFPVVGAVALAGIMEMWKNGGESKSTKWKNLVAKFIVPLVIWLLIILIVFIVAWPLMWNPVSGYKMIYSIVMQSFQSSDQHYFFSQESLQEISNLLSNYWNCLLSVTTPLEWFGLLLGLIVVLNKKIRSENSRAVLLFVVCWLYIFIYITTMAVIRFFSSPNYTTSAVILFSLTAGLGMGLFLSWIKETISFKARDWLVYIFAGVLLIVQVISILPTHPYYFIYRNPFIESEWKSGYGNFLDQAADYLSEKPNAEDLTVMSFYDTSFSLFFSGKTLPMWPEDSWGARQVEFLEQSDYLVVYYTQVVMRRTASLLDALEGIQPEKIISYDGVDYVWIYDVKDLPEEAFIPDQ